MHHVNQDEIVILLEMDESNCLPKDVFLHLNEIYRDAKNGGECVFQFIAIFFVD